MAMITKKDRNEIESIGLENGFSLDDLLHDNSFLDAIEVFDVLEDSNRNWKAFQMFFSQIDVMKGVRNMIDKDQHEKNLARADKRVQLLADKSLAETQAALAESADQFHLSVELLCIVAEIDYELAEMKASDGMVV